MPKHLLMFVLSVCSKFWKPWWGDIQKAIGTLIAIAFFLVVFFASLFVLTIVFYVAGLLVVGKKRALMSDALLISLLGTILSTLFFMFIPGWLALAISILTWLLLIKRFYETSWLRAIAVGLLAAIIYVALILIIALIFGIIEVIISLITR
ncbi:MAG: hypothetical protein QW270_01705 [Candidatus Bathyarchaeia archaeon]